MGKINQVTISGAAIVWGTIVGLILSFSQPLYNLEILVFLGWSLFFLTLKIINPKQSSFRLGYLAGLVYFLFTFKWFWAMYPLKNLGVENHGLAFFFIFFTWIITAGALALPWGISAALFKKLDQKISWPALLIFPSVFTVGEYLRSYLISLVWIGRQTPLGAHWTNGNLAYNLHQSWLALKVSSWVGIYGITFLIIFLSLLLLIFLEKRKYKRFLFLLLTILVLFYWPPPRPNLDGKTAEGAIVQTKVPSQATYSPAEEISFFKQQLELVDSISKKHPQTNLVVFPEESNFFKTLTIFKNTFGASQYFSNLFQTSVELIDNSKVAFDASFQSKTIILDSKKGVTASYDKYLITPGAEYVPWLFKELDKILGLNSSTIKEATEYKTGGEAPKKVLICADNLSPQLARQAASANVLISQSSFAFAAGAPDLLAQDLAISQFRAAENGRYLIKSSNWGHSFIISDQGKLEKITPNLDPQILTGAVVLKENKTLYNKVGDTPILWASLMVVLVSLFWRWRL